MSIATKLLSLILLSIMLYAECCELDISPLSLKLQASSGTKFSALCSCTAPPAVGGQFTWYRHGRLLVKTQRVNLGIGQPERIFFQNILVEDEGEYVCVFTLPDGFSVNTSLQVYVIPELLDNVESRSLSIGVGSAVELTCPVKSLNQHSTLSVQWNLPLDIQLSTANQWEGRFGFIPESKSLLLTQAQLVDNGSYVCSASNMAGRVAFVWEITVKEFVTKTAVSSVITSKVTETIPSLPTSSTQDSSTIPPSDDDETVFSLLSNPIYLTLIIVAFLFTCTLILITVIVSITCFCGFCYRNNLVSEEACTSSLNNTPPPSQSNYHSQFRDYSTKSGYVRQHTPSPATSLQSLCPHSTRRMNGQLTSCITDTSSLGSPMGHSQNYLAPIPTKHAPYHVRCPSDQADYHYLTTQRTETPCARCCPSVTMSEPRMSEYSPRLTQKCTSKKHSLPDRIDEPGPHPLTMVHSCDNAPYLHTDSMHQVEV